MSVLRIISFSSSEYSAFFMASFGESKSHRRRLLLTCMKELHEHYVFHFRTIQAFLNSRPHPYDPFPVIESLIQWLVVKRFVKLYNASNDTILDFDFIHDTKTQRRLKRIRDKYINEIKRFNKCKIGQSFLLRWIYLYCTQEQFPYKLNRFKTMQVLNIYASRRFPHFNNLIRFFLQDCEFDMKHIVERIEVYTVKKTRHGKVAVYLNCYVLWHLISIMSREDVVDLILAFWQVS